MREQLTFTCEGTLLSATLDGGAGTSGLLIVSGGNEIRVGAHRGMAQLALQIAGDGHPVLRFDRRGIGDSEGENHGFESSEPDIAAAIAAFKAACPTVQRIVAFGNCDAATALVLHHADVNGLVLANPWIVEPVDDLPAPAAIRDHYRRRLRDPKAWIAFVQGRMNLQAALRGLGRIAHGRSTPNALVDRMASATAACDVPTTILLARRDNTAIAFQEAWRGAAFAGARSRADISVVTLDSASHSFAGEEDFAALVSAIRDALNR